MITRSGERVRYLVGDEGAEYVAVCLPAFDPDRARRPRPAERLTAARPWRRQRGFAVGLAARA